MPKQYYSCLAGEMYDYLKLLENAGQNSIRYRTTFYNLDAFLVNNNVSEKALSESVVSRWLKTLTCGPKSKWNYTCTIRKFARYLTALEIPAYEPELYKTQSSYVAYTFSDEEFAAIIAAADNFAAIKRAENETSYVFPMLLRILYGCGLRLGEALALRWGDIDFKSEVIVIRKAKNHKQRIVPISSSLTETLRLYNARKIKDNPDASLLFESHRNKGLSYLNNTFRIWFLQILEDAGISNVRSTRSERIISPHTLRHYFTFKSFLKSEAEGRSLEESGARLAAYLGHESLSGTEKYITSNYVLYRASHTRMEENIGNLFPEVNFE
jgi:integrase